MQKTLTLPEGSRTLQEIHADVTRLAPVWLELLLNEPEPELPTRMNLRIELRAKKIARGYCTSVRDARAIVASAWFDESSWGGLHSVDLEDACESDPSIDMGRIVDMNAVIKTAALQLCASQIRRAIKQEWIKSV